MGRPPKVKKEVGTDEKEEASTETKTPDTRAKLKKVFVLNIETAVLKQKTIKAGTRLTSSSQDFYFIKQIKAEALKQIQDDMFEVDADVVIKYREKIPYGTILDPVKDKDIFVSLANVAGAIRETEGV